MLDETTSGPSELFERLPVGVYRTTPDGAVVMANPALARLLRYSLEELQGINVFDLYVDAKQRQWVLEQLTDGNPVPSQEIQLVCGDGTQIWARATFVGVLEEDGRVEYLEGILEDCTAQRMAEVALADSEEHFRAVFERAPQGLVILDKDMKMTRVNAAFGDMLGMTSEELMAGTGPALKHPDDVDDAVDRAQAIMDGKLNSYQVERRLRHKDGHYIWALVAVSAVQDPYGGFSGQISQIFDITELKTLHAELEESEARFRISFENAPIGMVVANADLSLQLANPALGNMLGVSSDELAGMSLTEIIAPDGVAGIRLAFERMASGESDGYADQAQLIGSDGVSIWAHLSASVVHDTRSPDAIHCVLVQVVDVTNQHRSAEALLKRDEQSQALLDSLPDMMLRITADGIIHSWRPARDFGPAVPPEDFLGARLIDVLPEHGPQFMSVIQRVLSANRTELVEYALELEEGRRDYEASIAALGDDEVLAVVRDITDRRHILRRLEELVQSKDELVASVSHDLRTPLTSVVGFAQELRDREEDFTPAERAEMIGVIAEQSAEMTELVDDLLEPARGHFGLITLDLRSIDLVAEVTDVLQSWTEADVRLVTSGGPVLARADEFRLRQVIRNLLANATSHGQGAIVVEVGDLDGRPSVIVLDEGPALREDQWQLIFEPYYRAHHTAAHPESVGLGLFVSRGLIALMDGELRYQPRDGTSCFEIILPSPEGSQ